MDLPYTGSPPEVVNGPIGRYGVFNDFFTQARTFWGTLDIYAQQATVDAYRFELGHVTDPGVQQRYIDQILNNVDNCLVRRVAFGIGAPMPARGSGPMTNITNATSYFPSLYPLAQGIEPNKSNAGLVIGIIAADYILSTSDLNAMLPVFASQNVMYEVVAPHIGPLATGVTANQSYITTSSIFYDAVILGSMTGNGTFNTTSPTAFVPDEFLHEAYSHGKALGAVGNAAMGFQMIDLQADASMGIFEGDAATVAMDMLQALSGPVRFPWRFPVDDPSICQ